MNFHRLLEFLSYNRLADEEWKQTGLFTIKLQLKRKADNELGPTIWQFGTVVKR